MYSGKKKKKSYYGMMKKRFHFITKKKSVFDLTFLPRVCTFIYYSILPPPTVLSTSDFTSFYLNIHNNNSTMKRDNFCDLKSFNIATQPVNDSFDK